MITPQQWCRIGSGDILIDRSGVHRVVLEGPRDVGAKPRDHASRKMVTLAIRRRSWTGRAHTVVNYTDAKNRFTFPKKLLSIGARAAICRANTQRLIDIGFDVVREAKRELAESVRFQAEGSAAARRARVFLKRRGVET